MSAEFKEKWHQRMLEKYGSEEAIAEVMRANSNKSRRNSAGTGGWAHLKATDPDKFKALSSEGGKKSRRNGSTTQV